MAVGPPYCFNCHSLIFYSPLYFFFFLFNRAITNEERKKECGYYGLGLFLSLYRNIKIRNNKRVQTFEIYKDAQRLRLRRLLNDNDKLYSSRVRIRNKRSTYRRFLRNHDKCLFIIIYTHR